MKTYEQVIQQSVLHAAYSYFNGGNYWSGASAYITAVDFIYGVSRETFRDDFLNRWFKVMQVREARKLDADQVIAYIKENM